MEPYSRDNPSAHYRELIVLYRQLHSEGDPASGTAAEHMFDGRSLMPHGGTIKLLVERFGARTLLDYGSGKGRQYGALPISLDDGRSFANMREFWGVDEIVCYDPANPSFDALPARRFDGVISTDVLEHCPEEDLPWIVGEIFAHASRFVFATVALYAASKNLPNGENAHCTLKPSAWWKDLIRNVARDHSGVRYRVELYVGSPTNAGSDGAAPELLEG